MPPPPPATPSPRRFLPGTRHPSPNKNSKATPSALRNQLSSGDAFDQPKSTAKASMPSSRRPERGRVSSRPVEVERGDAFAPSTPSNRPASSGAQFAQPPRFSLARPPAQSVIRQPIIPPPRQNLAQALRQRPEEVQSQSQSQEDQTGDDDEEMLELEDEGGSVPTTTGDHESWSSDVVHSPKRRRLDQTPGRPIFKHPATPAPDRFSRAPGGNPSPFRPTFLRPSIGPSATETSEPPPEAFSPHRRGEKFLPGGMAATLQQWVVETGQAAVQSRKGQGYLKGEEYVLCVKVESVVGSGHFLVSGRRLQDGDEVRVMLGVDGKKRVVEGSIVGIRAPIWEVEIQGVRWSVGVDWKVL